MNAFFNSKWTDCPDGVVRAIRNPFSQEIIDTVPECGDATVDLAISHLKVGVDTLAHTSSEAMGNIFAAATEMIRTDSEDLARLITREQGKPLVESRQEVAATINLMESFGKEAFRFGHQLLPLAGEARIGDRFGYTRRRPYGVAAVLTPNTFPLLIPAMLIVPALAAGNAVVLNPASQTPFSSLRLVRILLEAGLPENAIACLTGPGEHTGDAICRHPLVDQISCKGGMATIHSIRAAIGLIPLQFHHGGMGVCIVAEDGNLEMAARQIVKQSFENTGQTAISTSAVFASEKIYEELLGHLQSVITDLPMGDPAKETTRIGPLTEAFRAVRAARMIGDLTASGIRCLNGSGMNDGNFIEPTLLAGIDPENQRFFPHKTSREILAPIIGVTSVSGALRQVAGWLDPRTQLAASIFSENLDRATQIASLLPVYNIHINGIPTWRDGLIFNSQALGRLGRRKSQSRVNDMSTSQDIVFYQA